MNDHPTYDLFADIKQPTNNVKTLARGLNATAFADDLQTEGLLVESRSAYQIFSGRIGLSLLRLKMRVEKAIVASSS
jgi:hypothetical protein